MSTLFYEDGLDNLYSERGEKVYDPMEGILTDVSDPNIVLENTTSREKYLGARRPEKSREPTSTKKQSKHEESRKATSYKNYNDLTRETFIDRMLEHPVERGVVSKVAKDLNINYRTALRWWHLYNETEEFAYKKSEKNAGRESSFTAAHNAHIYELIDNDPQLVSDDIIDSLTKNFEDFKISKSQLNNHLRNTMLIAIKKPVFEAEVRNSAENLQTRYEWFMKWRDSDLDHTENCVFIDEAGFHINMRNNWARSKSGSIAVVKQPKTRSLSHTVIGAIHPSAVMHVVMKKPPPRKETEAAKKKRKSNTGKKRTAAEVDRSDPSTEEGDMSNKPTTKSTTTAHFVKFINGLLDIMDMDESMKGHYLVLDNASIHKSKPMVRKIESRGYRVMYLPPYSPESNPIEQFWAIVKGKMKRDRLMTEENLSSRIADACNDVLISDLYDFCSYSKRQIINCFNKTPFYALSVSFNKFALLYANCAMTFFMSSQFSTYGHLSTE